MDLTDAEKRLIEASRKLESRKCRDDLMVAAETMFRAQGALKEDYGLVDLPNSDQAATTTI